MSVKGVAETRPPMITMLGLLPMALSKGIGSEVQNPLAVTSDPSSAALRAQRIEVAHDDDSVQLQRLDFQKPLMVTLARWQILDSSA